MAVPPQPGCLYRRGRLGPAALQREHADRLGYVDADSHGGGAGRIACFRAFIRIRDWIVSGLPVRMAAGQARDRRDESRDAQHGLEWRLDLSADPAGGGKLLDRGREALDDPIQRDGPRGIGAGAVRRRHNG